MITAGTAAFIIGVTLAATPVTAQTPANQVVRYLRFSPDGRYALVQRVADIAVLATEPFRLLFVIPAGAAGTAEFTQDSRQLRFLNRSWQVESWSVPAEMRVALSALDDRRCASRELSPDGHTLACVGADGTLRIVDVFTGRRILRKRRFGCKILDLFDCPATLEMQYSAGGAPIGEAPVGTGACNERDLRGRANFRFSPDSRFVLAEAESGSRLAFDLRAGERVDPRVAEQAMKPSLDFTHTEKRVYSDKLYLEELPDGQIGLFDTVNGVWAVVRLP